MPLYSREQVLAMAPDASAAKAGLSLANAARWSRTGTSPAAVWGECQGSGQTPYRSEVDLSDGATKCSCPSRKFPCKHCLALLLLYADDTIAEAAQPDWVTEWLADRVGKAQVRAERSAAMTDAPPDPAAQARRQANREAKVDAGVVELRRWAADLATQGLAAAQSQPRAWWDTVAARMVDAQAGGLATYVRMMGNTAALGAHAGDWPERLLDQLGAMALLTDGWSRRDSLPQPLRDTVRSRVGFTTPAETVQRDGQRVTDNWTVVGQRITGDDRLRTLQQWLHGETTEEWLTILSFAHGGAPFDTTLAPGRRTEATLALHPGQRPRRALVLEQHGDPSLVDRLPGQDNWYDALGIVATTLADDPWSDVQPMAVRRLTVLTPASSDAPWTLRDETGAALPIDRRWPDTWSLLAISGGRPVDVAVTWNGFTLTPLAAGPSDGTGVVIL